MDISVTLGIPLPYPMSRHVKTQVTILATTSIRDIDPDTSNVFLNVLLTL